MSDPREELRRRLESDEISQADAARMLAAQQDRDADLAVLRAFDQPGSLSSAETESVIESWEMDAEISKMMARDKQTLDALLANAGHPMGPVDELSRYYRAALEKLHGDKPRLGLYGTAWLAYVEGVDACVVDWSEIEKRASAAGVPAADGEAFRQQSRDFIHQRTSQCLEPGRLLELEPGLDSAERIERTMRFLRQSGLA
jgi:hypothetical protein